MSATISTPPSNFETVRCCCAPVTAHVSEGVSVIRPAHIASAAALSPCCCPVGSSTCTLCEPMSIIPVIQLPSVFSIGSKILSISITSGCDIMRPIWTSLVSIGGTTQMRECPCCAGICPP
eukprot:CAMPEP_0181339326 /NCGR_PEP_ID=MMETSP1101-20121128/29188_1 /TAXON_ID=46948 /ORGANISM="Rhodomonas abbreviata, Strain Caron Lab Isolate" /LENGTH=120 /DNA_ID=CAMNT_0023450271 /DNA_START=1351 /DNA_END=1713 /DNA_ORIENTATION=+